MHGFHIIDLRKRKPLAVLYAASTLRAFAFSFINIFLPLFLLKSGYSIENILIFYFIQFAAAGVASIMAAKSLEESGIRLTVGTSSAFLIVFYLLLFYIDIHSIPIYVLAIFAGFGEAFYIVPINVYFSITADKKHEGEEVGLLFEIPFIATILGPIIGGAIVHLIGFDALFFFASLIMLTSIIPLFWAKEIQRKHKFKMPEKVSVNETLGILSAGARDTGVFVFWPLFLFLLVKQFVAVGIVESFSIFSAAVVTLLIGKLSDNYGEKKVLEWGSIANAVSWPLRVMFTTLSQLIFVALYIGVSALSLLVPMQSIIYKNARKNPIQYFIFEQFMRAFGRVFMLILVLVFAANLYIGLLFCSIAALGCSLYTKK